MEPNNQYEFITNPQSANKSKAGLNLSKKQLIIFGAAGLILLLIIITLISSVLNSGPTNKDHLLVVANQQNELVRVSDIGIKEARSIQAKNLAMTTKLSIRSDQSTLAAALKAQNVKVSSRSSNAETDKKLNTAMQNNRFDEEFIDHLQNELSKYQKNLNTAYSTTVSNNLKEVLRVQYQNASTLIGEDPEL